MGQYDRVMWRGEPITRRQRAAFRETEKRLDKEFYCYQGSWQPQTSYSGTTHTKAGVADLWLPGIGDNEFSKMVTRQLRKVGCQAAFLRGPMPQYGDFSSWHWHCCDLDTHGMDSNAAWQVSQYRLGYNGLNSGVPDPLPYRPSPIKVFDYNEWLKLQSLKAKLSDHMRELRLARRKVEATKDQIQDLKKH